MKTTRKTKDEIDRELVVKTFETDAYMKRMWEGEYVDGNKLTETALYFLKLGRDGKVKAGDWNINNAKEGDVLTTDLVHFIFKSKDDTSCYMHCNYSVASNHFNTSDTAVVNSMYVHPASKEQRDLLFKKLREAGYEWDDNKKELRRIKPKH